MSKHETLTTLRQLKQFAEEAAELAKGRSRDDLAADLRLRRHAERVIELIGEPPCQPRSARPLRNQCHSLVTILGRMHVRSTPAARSSLISGTSPGWSCVVKTFPLFA
jgi:hypothetical protein